MLCVINNICYMCKHIHTHIYNYKIKIPLRICRINQKRIADFLAPLLVFSARILTVDAICSLSYTYPAGHQLSLLVWNLRRNWCLQIGTRRMDWFRESWKAILFWTEMWDVFMCMCVCVSLCVCGPGVWIKVLNLLVLSH